MTVKYEQNSLEGDVLLVVRRETGKEDQIFTGEDVIIEMNRLTKENEKLKRVKYYEEN